MAVLVGDVEGNVVVMVIYVKTTRDGGLWPGLSLDANQVHLPGMIHPDRACLCLSHTSSTFLLSFTLAMTHPFGNLAYLWYWHGIFVVFCAGVDADGIALCTPLLLWASCCIGMEVPQGVLRCARRFDEHWLGILDVTSQPDISLT